MIETTPTGTDPLGGEDPGKLDRARRGIPVIPALDGFRALAIFGIVLLHTTGVPESSGLRTLQTGTLPNMVDVLFILSGFVVFLPTVARGGEFGSVASYAIRRAARLLPAFWLAIVVVIAMLVLWPTDPGPGWPGTIDTFVHFTGLHGYGRLIDPDFNLGLLIDGPMWTLTLEVTFYALLPLIASRYYRHPIIGLLLAAVITAAWKLSFQHMDTLIELVGANAAGLDLTGLERRSLSQFPAFAFQFGLGMTAAWAYVRLQAGEGERWMRRWSPAILAGSLVVLGVCAYLFGRYGVETVVLAPTAARRDILLTLALPTAITAFMLATCFAPRILQLPFAHPKIRALGDISYGIYLIHLPILFYLYGLFLPDDISIGPIDGFLARFLTVVPLSVLYGWASARFLEQPVRGWARQYGRRTSGSAESSESAPGGVADRLA